MKKLFKGKIIIDWHIDENGKCDAEIDIGEKAPAEPIIYILSHIQAQIAKQLLVHRFEEDVKK